MNPTFTSSDALLVVDLQYDFLPDGALHVPGGDEVIPMVNALITAAKAGYATIVASRDWHPIQHISFQEQGGPWPPHCVQDTLGAEFHRSVTFPENTLIISKAFKVDQEAYSAFSGETADGQSLSALLNKRGVQRIIICGLALDYCVKATALDAIKHDLETIVVLEATRAIDPKEGQETIRLLKSFGVVFV